MHSSWLGCSPCILCMGLTEELCVAAFEGGVEFHFNLVGQPSARYLSTGDPHEQNPQSPNVGLEIMNPPSARLAGSVSPKHCITDIKNFFSQ